MTAFKFENIMFLIDSLKFLFNLSSTVATHTPFTRIQTVIYNIYTYYLQIKLLKLQKLI